MSEHMTYAESGVDIDKKGEAIESLVKEIGFKRKGLGSPIDMKGHFTGLIDFGDKALALCTDGVGTKLMIADELKKWDTIGIDCIAMNVNDLICAGAEPVAFVDYIAIDRPEPQITEQIGRGLQDGARMSNMTIIGGEVAVLPEIVKGFDLAGTALGYVDKDGIITGEDIVEGDVIISLGSSGLHSNGYTLARKAVERKYSYMDRVPEEYREEWVSKETTIGELLLTPTKIYVKSVLAVLERERKAVHGMANITGGGLRNLLRLKKGMKYVIDVPPRPPRVFQLIQDAGNITDKEMYQTFNMGIGFVLVVDRERKDEILAIFRDELDEEAWEIGRVEKGTGVEVPEFGLRYERY